MRKRPGKPPVSTTGAQRARHRAQSQVHAFRTRRLDGEYPYLFLDATFEKVREGFRSKRTERDPTASANTHTGARRVSHSTSPALT